MIPLGLSGSIQDSEILFLDVRSFLMTVTADGAAEREGEKHYRLAASTLYHTKPKVTGSSADIFIQQFASCELVPVDLIEFALHWGSVSKLGKLED